MTMDLSEVVGEFVQRTNDASATDTGITGQNYINELVGRRDDDGTILWESQAWVKPWALWLKEERGKSVWQASRADVRAHLRDMSRADYAPKSMNLRLAAISTFYQDIKKMSEQPEYDLPGSVDGNPAENIDKSDFGIDFSTKRGKGLKAGSDIHAPSAEEVEAMCNNVSGSGPQALRDELIIRLCAWCGLRRKEVADLKVEHIDRSSHEVWVPPVKSDDGRPVPYPEGTTMNFLFDQWLDGGYRQTVENSYAGDSDYLFPTKQSENIAGYTVNTIVKDAAENAGIQGEPIGEYANGGKIHKITAHSLRHHYGVQAIKSGIEVAYLRDLMGHSSTSVTEVYTDLAGKDTVEAGRRFDPTATSD